MVEGRQHNEIQAKCPFYKAHTKNEVICSEDLDGGDVIHVKCRTHARREQMTKEWCFDNYKACYLCRALYIRFGEEDPFVR